MILKFFVLRRESFNAIVNQCTPGTIAVVRPEKKLQNLIREVIHKMIVEKQPAGREVAAVTEYLKAVSPNAEYLQKVEVFIDYIQDYLRRAMGYPQLVSSVENYLLAQCAYLCAQAVAFEAGVEVMDGRELVVCNEEAPAKVFDWAASSTEIRRKCAGKECLVVSGGYARTLLGTVLGIGKGGANMMTALMGSALHAEVIEFYVEGEGINGVSAMTYDEAAHYCASSTAPFPSAALWPAKKAGIPIVVKSILHPEFAGTRISAEGEGASSAVLSGIISEKDLDLVTVYGTGLLGQVGASSTIFSSLAGEGINIRFISQTSSEYAISFAVPGKDSAKVAGIITSLIEENPLIPPDDVMMVNREVGIITVYGSRMKNIPGVSGKVFSLLGQAGINVIASAQGGEELSISIVLDVQDLQKAVKALEALR